jgi:ferritin-like metal-binding protein YciE
MTDDEVLLSLLEQHLDESRVHATRIEQRLSELGASPSAIKDAALRLGALNWAGFFQAHPDTPGKLVTFLYAFEHLEIGGYLHLRGVALEASDQQTAALAAELCGEEERAAELLSEQFDHAADLSLAMLGVAV